MTNYENLKTKNIHELLKWLREYWDSDTTPWTEWFDKTYCKNCEGVIARVPDYHNKEMEFGYCELYDKCRFFEDMNMDDEDRIINLWLESEVDI